MSILASSILIGVTGLAVDYGNAVMQEARLQTSVDIATLAGVQELPYRSRAYNEMKESFIKNYTRHDECNVVFESDDDSCWTIASHAVPTHFMRIFGRNDLTIHARAKAILETTEGMSGGIGVMPFVLVNPNKNSNPHDDLEESNHGKPYLLKYGSNNIMVEDWYFGRQIVGEDVIHNDDNLPDGGWRSVLGLDPNSNDPEDVSKSASDFLYNFVNGWPGEIEIGDIIASNPGVMDSATRKGRTVRLDGFETVDWEGFDANLDPQNPRIVVCPIVSLGYRDACGVWHEATQAQIESGEYTWKESKVDSVAAFFILTEHEQQALPGGDKLDRKWIVGRYMYGVNIGGLLTSPGGSEGPDYGMFHGRLVPFDEKEI